MIQTRRMAGFTDIVTIFANILPVEISRMIALSWYFDPYPKVWLPEFPGKPRIDRARLHHERFQMDMIVQKAVRHQKKGFTQ